MDKKTELPEYNKAIEVTQEQYKKALRDMDGLIFHKQHDNKFYIKLASEKLIHKKQLSKIIAT